MYLTREYVNLQVTFAQKLCELDSANFADYFYLYTDAPRMLCIDSNFWHPNEPHFKKFSQTIEGSSNLVDTIFKFAQKKQNELPAENYKSPYGFFHCNLRRSSVIELHTLSDAPLAEDEVHPLSKTRLEETKSDLYKMLKDSKEKFPSARFVQGASWLYNIDAYRRLFPAKYLETAEPNLNYFHGYGLWGQFLDKRLQVKTGLAESFYHLLTKATNFEQALAAFPYKVLSLKAPLSVFLN